MSDTGICPWCDKQFDTTEYGYGLSCPECGKSIDIFPDNQLFIDTKFGTIGVSSVDSILGTLRRFLF